METTCNRSSSSNNHLILKLSRLFPSSFTSCNFRTLVPDVIVPHLPSSSRIHQHPPPPSSNFVLPNNNNKVCSETSLLLPPSSHKSSHPSNLIKRGRGKPHSRSKTITYNTHVNHPLGSSSSYTSCFTTTNDDHESDTFFSLSSYSGLVGDSFRLKSAACSRRFSQEMKRIDERGSSRSFSSVNTRKTAASSIPDDQISAQLYYGGCPDRHHATFQRTSKMNRRKAKKNKSSSLNHRRSLEWNNPMMEESYAVEKRSKDPRADFRASMVEMIVEKQMFGERDLEKLLECFLSLNSESYHGIIIQVFTEICETLFSN